MLYKKRGAFYFYVKIKKSYPAFVLFYLYRSYRSNWKIRKIASQQRQAVNAIPKNDNQEITNSRKFMEENGILNVYKLNLYQVLNFMFRVHNEAIPKSFQTKF